MADLAARNDLDEMQAVLRGMGLPNEQALLQKFVEERITPQVVPCLTDEQLIALGVTTIGDRTTLRQRCQRPTSRGGEGLKAELQAIMRPSSACSTYNVHATIPRRGKGKYRASSCLAAPRVKRANTFKNVNVLRFMGFHAPREFGRSEKDILCTFFYEINAESSGEEVKEDITRLVKQSNVEFYDFSALKPCDVEFVKCAGKVCRVPQTDSGFVWSASAIRTLAGQGDLYVRLREDFAVDSHTCNPPQCLSPKPCSSGDHHAPVPSTSLSEPHSSHSSVVGSLVQGTSRSSLPLSIRSHPSTSETLQEGTSLLSSRSSGPDSSLPMTPEIDLTQSSSSEEDLPSPVFTKPPELLKKEKLYEIFAANITKAGVDEIVRLCRGDTTHALKILLGGPEVRDILQLKREVDFSEYTKKLTVDEDDMLEEALVYYKHPKFDPCCLIRISLRDQPAIDTGGITRQFFTDVLHKIAQDGLLQLFVGDTKRLRLAYSSQVLPMMKILGTLIAHSLLQEGPGFPYFAPFVYWYIATGSEERALQYVSIHEDLSPLAYKVVSELQLVESEVEFSHLIESSDFNSLMESSGSRRLPVFSNKDAIAQDFVLHDTLLRGKSALEQISCGLANVGVLSLIRLFPMEFEPLFTHLRDEEVTSASLLTLFRFPDNLNDCQEATADMLREFIRSCSSEDRCRLLRYVTGSECLPAAGYATGIVSVQFLDSNAIIGATCSLKLTLPTSFQSYSDFCQCIQAVLPPGRKSYTMI